MFKFDSLLASRVIRWHCHTVNYRQSMADRGFQMIRALHEKFETDENIRFDILTKHIVMNSLSKCITGDSPSYAKSNINELPHSIRKKYSAVPGLTGYELKVFEWLKLYERYEYANAEVELGNRFFEPILDTLRNEISSHPVFPMAKI